MIIQLLRYTLKDSLMTRGILIIDGFRFCDTLELPWKNNEAQVSCIPDGIYKYTPHLWKGKYPTVHLLDVPSRSDILIHFGNFLKDIKGCILVGNISKKGLAPGSAQILEKIVKLLPTTGEIDIKWV